MAASPPPPPLGLNIDRCIILNTQDKINNFFSVNYNSECTDFMIHSIADLAWLWQYHAQKDSSAFFFSFHAPQVGSRILLLYTPANYIFRSLGKSATKQLGLRNLQNIFGNPTICSDMGAFSLMILALPG